MGRVFKVAATRQGSLRKTNPRGSHARSGACPVSAICGNVRGRVDDARREDSPIHGRPLTELEKQCGAKSISESGGGRVKRCPK
jgi:hypothetical protein